MRFKSRPELLSHSRPRTFLVPNEVFLSHSSQDRTFVERLADVLRAHGVPIWYSDAGKMADQRAVGRDDRPGRLYDQTLPCQPAVP